MKALVVFATLTFSALPGLVLADCRGEQMEQTVASCLPGMVWDETTATCIEAPSS